VEKIHTRKKFPKEKRKLKENNDNRISGADVGPERFGKGWDQGGVKRTSSDLT